MVNSLESYELRGQEGPRCPDEGFSPGGLLPSD